MNPLNWGIELWDQFENIALHTQHGIDFCDRFGSFLKERCNIENEYAAKLKKLIKNYQPKKKEDCDMMNELNDIAGQHEMIAENLVTQIVSDITQLILSLRQERKRFLQDGTKQMQSLQAQLMELEKSKRQYEKSHRESEKALDAFRKSDADIHLSRADVEKAKNNSIARQRACDESKNAYAAELQKTNQVQHEHYHTLMPKVFENLQQLEERRVGKVQEYIQKSADIENDAIPIINTCIAGIVSTAKNVSPSEDSRLTVEKYKSGFLMPTDIPFEEQESSNINGNHSGLPGSSGDSPPASAARGRSRSAMRVESLRSTMSSGSQRSRKRAGFFGIFGKDEEAKEDYSHLPPNQQKKKLTEKIDSLKTSLAKHTAARDGLLKMQDVFSKNPKMGDPTSLAPQLDENSRTLDQLQQEIRKYETYMSEAENRSLLPDSLSDSNSSLSISTSSQSSVQQTSTPVATTNHTSWRRFRPGRSRSERNAAVSYDPSGGHKSAVSTQSDRLSVASANVSRHVSTPSNSTPAAAAAASSASPQSLHTSSEQHDSFDDFDEDVTDSSPMQPIGTCVALYPFDAPSEGSIPMNHGEEFYVIETDQGDGWTRVRRRANSEEGFVPTTYIRSTAYSAV